MLGMLRDRFAQNEKQTQVLRAAQDDTGIVILKAAGLKNLG